MILVLRIHLVNILHLLDSHFQATNECSLCRRPLAQLVV